MALNEPKQSVSKARSRAGVRLRLSFHSDLLPCGTGGGFDAWRYIQMQQTQNTDALCVGQSASTSSLLKIRKGLSVAPNGHCESEYRTCGAVVADFKVSMP